MSKSFEIKGLEGLKTLEKRLGKATVQNVASSVLNRTGRSTISRLPRALKERYALKTKAADLKKHFYVKPADWLQGREMQAEIRVRRPGGRPAYLSYLSDFNTKERSATFRGRRVKVISARILKSGGQKTLKDKGRLAFIMSPKKGGRFVAVRKGKERRTVKKMAISIPAMLGHKEQQALEAWREDLAEKLEKELKRLLDNPDYKRFYGGD